jgi:hypothetical protein
MVFASFESSLAFIVFSVSLFYLIFPSDLLLRFIILLVQLRSDGNNKCLVYTIMMHCLQIIVANLIWYDATASGCSCLSDQLICRNFLMCLRYSDWSAAKLQPLLPFYRICFVVTLFFLLLSLVMIGVKTSRDPRLEHRFKF